MVGGSKMKTWWQRVTTFLLIMGISTAINAAITLVPLSQQPLLTTVQQPPNIMFVIDTSGSMDMTVPDSGGLTRLSIAKQVVNDLLNSLTGVRVGLSTYNSNADGARVRVGINDITLNLTTMTTTVNGLSASGGTPLSNTEYGLGRYFVQNYNQTLTLHPGQTNETTKSAYTIFSAIPDYSFGVTQASPIQYYCQKSFIIFLTDGDPSPNDPQPPAASGITDYIACPTIVNDQGVTIPCGLATSAAAMYDMDLRPDLIDPTINLSDPNHPIKKNNVITYTIGFIGISPAGQELLQLTADNAGGAFFLANNATELVQAFQNATSNILFQSVSAASVAFNGSNLTANSFIYQPSYSTTKWSGSLLKLPVSQSGVIGSPVWDAADILNQTPPANRLIFTYNTNTNAAVLFQTLSNLSTAQQQDLNTGTLGALDSRGQQRLNYIRGDRSLEKDSAHPTNPFRARATVLGDIVDSSPVYVGPAVSNWPDTAPFPTNTSQKYSVFKASVANRTPIVYIGSNDGMLHAFNANNGQEVFAYIPSNFSDALAGSSILPNNLLTNIGLHYLTDPNYAHRFYTDLTPAVQDVYIKTSTNGSPSWHTILVGGERAGGQGYFALDITNPSDFTAGNIDSMLLWEFTNRAAPFGDPDLGYAYSDPQIALMNNGRWAAIFGNGYNVAGIYDAQLFIVYLDGGLNGQWVKGQDYVVLNTRSGRALQPISPNSLATPAVIDIDGNGTADRIYAGDLNGDLWAFDVSGSSDTSWGTAYGTSTNPVALFKGDLGKPITTQPVVAINPGISTDSVNTPNLLVMVGTGIFFGTPDKTDTSTQQFIGVWDRGVGNIQTNKMVNQTFTTTGNARVLSNNSVTYTSAASTTQYGWYINFTNGERIIFPASLINARVGFNQYEPEVIFSTFKPNTSTPCSYGGSGSVMVAKVVNGGQPSTPVIDINNDSQLSDLDYINGNVASGLLFTGVPSQSVIRGDYLFVPTSTGTIVKIRIVNAGLPIGRISWQILKQNN
jgi:type IV pilus assembly protein PilY1